MNTEISVKETNEHGFGFECKVSVEPQLPDRVSFDIAWQQTDDDGTEDIESVGVLMSPKAALFIAGQLQEAAFTASKSEADLDD